MILIGGGARSGKSAFALDCALRRSGPRTFVATAQAFDDEMRQRIERHRMERGDAFVTREAPLNVQACLDAVPAHGVVVIDCLTLWLSNLLLAELSDTEIEERISKLAQRLGTAPYEALVVTNEVGLGLVPPTPLGRRFRDLAGRAHQQLSQTATAVYFAAMGMMLELKPGPVRPVTAEEVV